MVGIVVAGGNGARLGGAKPVAQVAGRSLLDRALDALRQVTPELAVVAKGDTPLPPLGPEVALWLEPEHDHHPRHGIVHALERAAGRSVLVLAVDLPLITPGALRRLVEAASGSLAAIAASHGRLQPLCGVYDPGALAVLADAAPDEPLNATVARLEPVVVALHDETELTNVNAPVDLARAAAILASRTGGSVTTATTACSRPADR